MIAKKLVISALILVGWQGSLHPQSPTLPDDNITIFHKLAASVVSSLLSEFEDDQWMSYNIVTVQPGDNGNWLLENAFVRTLLDKGKKVQLNSPLRSGDQMLIEFKIEDIGLSYQPIDNNKLVERQFNLDVKARLVQGKDNSVVLLKRLNEKYVDQIKLADVNLVENQNYPFTCAKIQLSKTWKKYIEPFLVFGVTAGVIYSFFALRSK
ncbi:MAG: hypothetical protein SCK70_03720 [bacterium]|nr:hypothetical protein [bacterium]